MRNKITHIILVLTSLLVFGTSVNSQSRVGRILDNMVLEAVDMLDKGNVKEAEKVLQDALFVNPSSDAAWYYMGEVAIHKPDVNQALECYTKAVELDSDNFWYRYRLARLYSFVSREVAVEQYEQLIKDFPKKSDLYFDLAELYSGRHQRNREYDRFD